MKDSNDGREEDLAGMNHTLDMPHPQRAKGEKPVPPKPAASAKSAKGRTQKRKAPATSIGNA